LGHVKGEPTRFVASHFLRTPEIRDKMSRLRSGSRNGNWKGDEAGYRALHYWVAQRKQLTGKCSDCGRERETGWANISGAYLRDLDDFVEWCIPCHKEFDAWMEQFFDD